MSLNTFTAKNYTKPSTESLENFRAVWERLNKLYESTLTEFYGTVDFNAEALPEQFYHFVPSFSVLLNALDNQVIYSLANTKASQLDIRARQLDDAGYVCVLQGVENKVRITSEGTSLRRPWGISFRNLFDLCKRNGFIFEGTKFNQVENKISHARKVSNAEFDSSNLSITRKELAELQDFNITGIGKLSDGRYFISGLQGRSTLNKGGVITSKLFTNSALYELLYNWCHANMANSTIDKNNRHIWYEFKNNNIGSPILTYSREDKLYSLNTSGNLNKYYKPRTDTTATKGEEESHATTLCFGNGEAQTKFNVAFDEIMGWGPIWVTEGSKTLLKIDYVNPSVHGGYSGPRVWGKNIINDKYAGADLLEPQGSNGNNIDLVLSKSTAEKIYFLFDEGEYRGYLPEKVNLRFWPINIASVILPKSYFFNNFEVRMDKIIDVLEQTPKKLTTISSKVLNKTGCILDKTTNKINTKELPDKLLYLLARFISVAQKYPKAAIEWTSYSIIEDDHYLLNDSIVLEKEATRELSNGRISMKAHKRYLIDSSSIVPDLNHVQEKSYTRSDLGIKAPPSDIASVTLQNKKIETARLGAELILIGQTPSHKKAVLFVRNPKSADFFELPGGGLNYTNPDPTKSDFKITQTQFLATLETKLKIKTGITLNDCNIVKDTGYGLILNESKTAQDKNFKTMCNLSYYKLFFTSYFRQLSDVEIYTGFSFNNKGIIKQYGIPNEPGYTARLLWVLVDDLELNPGITSRYGDLIPLIKQCANSIKW